MSNERCSECQVSNKARKKKRLASEIYEFYNQQGTNETINQEMRDTTLCTATHPHALVNYIHIEQW